jgi:hypothetical protein
LFARRHARSRIGRHIRVLTADVIQIEHSQRRAANGRPSFQLVFFASEVFRPTVAATG